jgi:hypothetical protein
MKRTVRKPNGQAALNLLIIHLNRDGRPELVQAVNAVQREFTTMSEMAELIQNEMRRLPKASVRSDLKSLLRRLKRAQREKIAQGGVLSFAPKA